MRNDLAAAHTLAELAKRAHYAEHHFHRRFREVTGETPRQFVRRSRLERAAYLMMSTPERTLTDICYEVGFGDSSDFSRSFRQFYGLPPSEWRHSRRPRSLAAGEQLLVQVVTRPPMRLAVIRVQGIFGLDDLSQDYLRLLEWVRRRGLDPDRLTLVGMSSDNYRLTPAERVHYSFGFAVPASIEGDAGVHIREVPAFTAAAISINGGLPAIAAAWDHLYDCWFPARSWSPSNLPAMKLFHRRPDDLGWDRFDIDCAVAFRLDLAHDHGGSPSR